jgi:carboxypeptidase D
MVWVDQPIGTGYPIRTPKVTSQAEIAQNLVDFFKNWEKLFDIKNFKIYVTGENYAGRYAPHISAAMLHQNHKKYFDLSGVLVFDPCIG